MADDLILVVAAYQDLDAAQRGFDTLAAQVADEQVASRGLILVSKDADGSTTVHDTGTMPHTVPLAFTSYAGMDIGRDNGLVVDLEYEDRAPYAFTGRVRKVVFDLAPVSHDEEKALHQHALDHTPGEGAAG